MCTFEPQDPSSIQDFFRSHRDFSTNNIGKLFFDNLGFKFTKFVCPIGEFLTIEESFNIRLDTSNTEQHLSRITEIHLPPSTHTPTPKHTRRTSGQLESNDDFDNQIENLNHFKLDSEFDSDLPNLDNFTVPELPKSPPPAKPIVKSVVNITPGRDMRIPKKNLIRAVEEVERPLESFNESFMAGVPRAKHFESSESETKEETLPSG